MRSSKEDIVAEKHFRRLAEVLHAKFDVRISIISSIGIFYECDDKLALFFIDKFLCNYNYRCDSPWLNTTTSSDVTWEMPLSPPVGYWLRPQNIQTTEFVTDKQVITTEQLAQDIDDAIGNFNQIDEDEIRDARNGGWVLSDDESDFDLVARSIAGHAKLKTLGYEFRPKQCILIDTNTASAYNLLLWRHSDAMDVLQSHNAMTAQLMSSSSKEEFELKCATSNITVPAYDFKTWFCMNLSQAFNDSTRVFSHAVQIGLFDELFTSITFIKDAIKFFTDEKGQIASQALYYLVGVREKRLEQLKFKEAQK